MLYQPFVHPQMRHKNLEHFSWNFDEVPEVLLSPQEVWFFGLNDHVREYVIPAMLEAARHEDESDDRSNSNPSVWPVWTTDGFVRTIGTDGCLILYDPRTRQFREWTNQEFCSRPKDGMIHLPVDCGE